MRTLTLSDPALVGRRTLSDLILADSPIGFWTFSETSGTTVQDSTANNLDLTHMGSPTLGVPGPKAMSAVTVNGSSQRSVMPSASSLLAKPAAGSWSMEVWLKHTSTPFASAMVWRERNNDSEGEVGAICVNNAVVGTIEANIPTPSYGRLNVRSSTTGWNDGQWHHVVVTAASGGAATLYLDGAAAASSSTARMNQRPSNSRVVCVGSNAGEPFGQHFSGTFAAAAVYGYTLTAAQVLARYQA